MSKYHYRVTKFSKPFDEDDDQLKAMFWQAVAENLKGTDNLNIWLESSKTDVSTWKLLEGETDYKLLVCSYTAPQEDVALVDKIASRIGVIDWDINYVLECYKHSRPFVIVAIEEGNFDSIYFMERVDKDQLTDMEYALNNLPKKQVETIKVGDKVELGYWQEQSERRYWKDYSELQGVVISINGGDLVETPAKDLNGPEIEVEVDDRLQPNGKVRIDWPVWAMYKVKDELSYSTDDEKSWY